MSKDCVSKDCTSKDCTFRDGQTKALQALLKSNLGIEDPTLVEYILSLKQHGTKAVADELLEFPLPLIKSVLQILFDDKPAVAPSVAARSSLADASETHRPLALGSEPADGTADQQSGAATTSTKRTRCEPIWRHTTPTFLADASLQPLQQHTQGLRAETEKRSWLNKAAQHTLSKMASVPTAEARKYLDYQGQAQGAKRDRAAQRAPEKQSSLPVESFKHVILESIAENPIVIVVGDTGSGKTTQLTQFLHEAGYARRGKLIACTQPRRIAAISVAQRVAQEMQCGKVGGRVGYAVRFDDCTSSRTEIKYMTDGLLQREIMADPDLARYSVIMLDEAHERTVATDVLFALLKATVARRPDLRIIVTSATLDAAKFGEYFGGAPILRIPGRMYPVDIVWAKEPVLDYMESALETVKSIHKTNKDQQGDILVFLTGQAEIDLAVASVADAFPKGDLIPLPVYAAIPDELQSLIFNPAPKGCRKVVFATNIAETSLTIDGIKFVVDPGFAKTQVWDSRKGMSLLRVQPISQAQANQRSGRAGRTGPGTCYRLYTKSSFDKEMASSTAPEILRGNLINTVLLLKTMGIAELLKFDFMDSPPRIAFVSAMQELFTLGALNDKGEITELGRSMAQFPLDPALAKILLTAQRTGTSCLSDSLTIVSMMCCPSVLYRPSRPPDKRREADFMHRRLQVIESDHLTLLNVYNKWGASKFSRQWCNEHFVHFKNLLRARETRRQLEELLVGAGANAGFHDEERKLLGDRNTVILKALCAGVFKNAAKYDGDSQKYDGMDFTTLANDTRVQIHPSSALYRQRPEYVLYSSILSTSRDYMQTVSKIDPRWLLEIAPDAFREASEEGINAKQRSERLRPLHDKRSINENDWRISEQRHLLLRQKHR